MTKTLENRCRALVAELGLAAANDVRSVKPLTGGVASDIAVVELSDRNICIKFALPKLRVAAEWHVPVRRNAAEYAWLKVAAALCPNSAVHVFGRSEADHGFAMEYVTGSHVYLWKEKLLNGRISQEEAPRVAEVLGRVHGASARTGFDRAPFQNRDDFRAIRIEPYLTETTRVHPDLRAHIAPLEARLYESSQVLVHGDVSPKNILFRDRSAVLLDAECATMGDASFDAAFCLNHLILKAIHVPRIRAGLFKAAARFWEVYADHIHWEDPAALEKRVCALLPVLMLARVDGKSPVEYLGVDEQEHVRHIAKPLTLNPPHRISSFVAALRKACP